LSILIISSSLSIFKSFFSLISPELLYIISLYFSSELYVINSLFRSTVEVSSRFLPELHAFALLEACPLFLFILTLLNSRKEFIPGSCKFFWVNLLLLIPWLIELLQDWCVLWLDSWKNGRITELLTTFWIRLSSRTKIGLPFGKKNSPLNSNKGHKYWRFNVI